MARALTSATAPIQQPPVPKLAVFIKAKEGVPFDVGWERAEKAGLTIASNKNIHLLRTTAGWDDVGEALTCHSGSVSAYEGMGEKLRDVIVFRDRNGTRWVFPTGAFQGEKDIVLVMVHPNYTIEPDGKDKVVQPKLPHLVDFVEDFPRKSGWYFVDPKHGIPTGLNRAEGHGYYFNRAKTRVVPVACGYYIHSTGGIGWVVEMSGSPSDNRGMLVEADKAALRQISEEKPSGKLILLPSASQLPQPKIISPYEAIQQELVNRALRDLFRPYEPKYRRY